MPLTVLSKGQPASPGGDPAVDGRWAPPRGRWRSSERRHHGRLPGNQPLGAMQNTQVPGQHIVLLGGFISLGTQLSADPG